MRLEDALQLSQEIAAECDTVLGRFGWSRGAGANPDAHYWALTYEMMDGPPGWVWIFNLNDRGEDQIMIAHRPSGPHPSS
jgi:hypothetical protein